jgi:hypothetical protein
LEKAVYQDYLLVEQLLEIIFTFFTLKVLPDPDADPVPLLELLEPEEDDAEPESEPLPGVPMTRTW